MINTWMMIMTIDKQRYIFLNEVNLPSFISDLYLENYESIQVGMLNYSEHEVSCLN